MDETLLRVEKATKQFGGLTAVNNVSLKVPRGQIVGLIGPNGSGKTTLLSLISGTHSLTSGEVWYKGRNIGRLPPFQRARLGIARTFQVVKPLGSLTAHANVVTAALFGRVQHTVAQEVLHALSAGLVAQAGAEADEILQEVGLYRRRDMPADSLTIEDRKRLEVARTLAMHPELLLLDEVMAGLNAKEIEEVMELIHRVNARGVTIILVEHVMKAVMGVSDHVVVLHHGGLLFQGSPDEVASNPKVIAAYLGSRYAAKRAGGDTGA